MQNRKAPELWGGVECTINRIGDQYFEQLDRSGHTERIDDLKRFAELGIRALRQPVLWERTAPDFLEEADWTLADKWLSTLRSLGVPPIVGLVHHGSGPRNTGLLDPEFPEKLACYARAVAERYPWVEAYTPVNEPLTTARFSGLYGIWYPHKCDDRSFVVALLNQCRAVVLAMHAIRSVNSQAVLVQTDDLGKTFSSRSLRYQADFDNERRWLTWDLLCGRVTPQHPMWKYLVDSGANEERLYWFQENCCPPDIIGVNHYLTSERYLDDEVGKYRGERVGGNSKHRFVDVVAARVLRHGSAGPEQLLFEAWRRYGIPIAVTEVHNACTREEQLRWLWEVWNGATNLRVAGADIRAVTLWSLLGAHDWNSLVTCKANNYEPGGFDIRSPKPRPTAIAKLATKLANGEEVNHPLLQVPGWWKRPQRFIYGVTADDGWNSKQRNAVEPSEVRPVLITGGRGTLARAFERACALRGIPHRRMARGQLDIANENQVRSVMSELNPWAVINAAGYVRVDEAERDLSRCFRENTEGPSVLTAECARRGSAFVTFSSDLVFDGIKSTPYIETDETNPVNVYGKSKVEAERRVLDMLPSALVVRTSAFFSPWDEYNFVHMAVRKMLRGQKLPAATDAIVSPTYVPDLVEATLNLLIDEESGIFHLANDAAVSWAEFAAMIGEKAGLGCELVDAVTSAELNLPAVRPAYSALRSMRAWIMPTLEDALDRYFCSALKDLLADDPVAA